MIRVAEIRAGEIPHALAVESDTACAGTSWAPALKTDGESDRADCIPEGARLQLDPTIDVAAIPDITPGEVAVARALQSYGGYLIDRADTSLAIAFEVAPDASPSSTARTRPRTASPVTDRASTISAPNRDTWAMARCARSAPLSPRGKPR